jgi:hypothetical protein
MKANKIVRGFEVRVGDVIRPIHGQTMVNERTSVCELYGPDDFRQGYDAMTVTAVRNDNFDCIRPYHHTYGTLSSAPGSDWELVPLIRRDGFAYELLQRS